VGRGTIAFFTSAAWLTEIAGKGGWLVKAIALMTASRQPSRTTLSISTSTSSGNL